MSDRTTTLARVVTLVVAAAVALLVGWLAFVRFPGSFAELVGVVLTLTLVVVAVRVGGSLVDSVFPGYNVAEVTVEGAISRDGSGVVPGGDGTPADEIVDCIERADGDSAVDALLLKLNTPGGEVVPSDDIRSAAVSFDGPTVAYATDLCASGGMWIASGCDELWARDVSRVGSVGVLGLRPNLSDFLDERGVRFEEITAGEYKDAGQPVTGFSDADREYLQGLTDGFYDQFVDRVADGMELDPEFVRETEARVYLGIDAVETGLVDALGDREDVIDHLADQLGEAVETESFEPERGLRDRIGAGARTVAYSFGAGIAAHLAPDGDVEFRL